MKEYYLKLDIAKELAMVENNEMGRKIRRYFIEVEKRYRTIVEAPQNIFDFMRLAIDQIEENEKEIKNVKLLYENNAKQIREIQSKIDVTIKNDYCLASDIAEQLKVYSESGLPHSNLIGAIARQLGYKTSYKHYYEDKYIAYTIVYQKNTKNGEKGEIKEKGFKIDEVCYKINI